MRSEIELYKKKDGYVRNSILLLLAFATAFFPRIIDAIGAPPTINFVHFVIVPLACGIIISTTKVRNKKQKSIAKILLISLFVLLGVMIISALLNQAGVINVFLDWMLLTEPFLVIIAMVSIPFSIERFKKFKTWIMGFISLHIFLAFAQHFLITFGILRVTSMQPFDNVQGVFYLSGSGHVVGASVSMSFGLYFWLSTKGTPIWLRASVFTTAFIQLLFADAKQVIVVWMIAWVLLVLTRLKDIKTALQYIIAAILVSYLLYWCIYNVEAFVAFKGWIRPELYGPEGKATILKSVPFQIIPSYYKSSLNWLFGLGPGHTIGRLGGWMLKDYSSLLEPLGATIHPASQAVWSFWFSPEYYWLDSSFFAPLWGWAGIWGDLGFLGLAAYLFICSIVWCRICQDDFSRFQLLTVMIYGFIFTQMEEPGYMLSTAMLIGLAWQERQIIRATRKSFLYPNGAINQSL